MMNFLSKIWPSLIPICGYLIWWLVWGRKHKQNGTLTPAHKRLWLYTLLCSLALGILSLLFVAFSNEPRTEGTYVPATMKDGKVIPGRIVPEGEKP